MADKMLILENGRVFYGGGFGSQKTRIAEIVFNTAMVGYQEILSDPSYFGQIVIMSYPLIGNYGLADDDYESKNIYLSGFVVREYNDNPSNFRFTMSLGNIMEDYDVAGIQDLDTRELVRIIRDEGSMKAMITDASRPYEECLKELRAAKLEENPVKLISTKKVWYSRTRNPAFNVIAVDLGIKTNILRLLNKYGCNVAIVPHNTSKEDIMRLKPDGLLISSGPGGPELLTEAAALIKSVKGEIPVLGTGLGCQLVALAYGAKVAKRKTGHHGCNIPVRDLKTNAIEITDQNHCYDVDVESLKAAGLELTHVNLIDGSAEGIADYANNVLGVQFYPESAALPENGVYVLDTFINMMKKAGGNGNAQKNRY